MIIFRYKKEPTKDLSDFILRPVADVFLENRAGGWIEFHPYIDSGADVTLIPFSLGKFIGLKTYRKNVERIGGIKGSIPVIYHMINLRIGGIKLSAKIAWALIEEVPPLLGRTDIFDNFHITFKQDQGIITFETPKSRMKNSV